SLNMTICPAMVSMSETMWVERITIRSSASVWIKLRNRTRSRGSSPAVGSSRISSFGSFSMATAMPTRWSIPPENFFIFLSAASPSPTVSSR
ncbi:Mor transcription activator domain-containing protein, partial [Dysosmobacter welbionis]